MKTLLLLTAAILTLGCGNATKSGSLNYESITLDGWTRYCYYDNGTLEAVASTSRCPSQNIGGK